MGYKIVIQKTYKFDYWYAKIVSNNGVIIGTSRSYCSKQGCLKTWARFAKRTKFKLEIL